MENPTKGAEVRHRWVDHIPLIWAEPPGPSNPARLVIWLGGLGGRKEELSSHLKRMASMGFHAAAYDLWQHGERGTEDRDQIMRRVFGNFYLHMWPILARSTEDALRVIDWAETEFGPLGKVCMGGISMGGDISVAALPLDRRIECAAAAIATADWRRPGMDIPPGEPDSYARLMYERLNPMTHTASYVHCPAITFECGETDAHVPPEGALRFRDALRDTYAACGERLRVTLHRGTGHRFTRDMLENCLEWFVRHTR